MIRPATKRVKADEQAILSAAAGSLLIFDPRKIGASIAILAESLPKRGAERVVVPVRGAEERTEDEEEDQSHDDAEKDPVESDEDADDDGDNSAPDDDGDNSAPEDEGDETEPEDDGGDADDGQAEDVSPQVENTPGKVATVAIVRIDGPLAQRRIDDMCGFVDGYDAIAARVTAALADPQTDALLLVIDSPGGDVAGCEEAVAEMSRVKAAEGKPVVVYVDECAASAGYWIAAALGDEIWLPTAGEVGSIGCLALHCDITEGERIEGRSWTVVREPAGKADGSMVQPVMDLAMQRMTEGVKSVAGRFYASVAAARTLTVDVVAAMNGAMYEGPKAVAVGLADHVGSLRAALERAGALSQETEMAKVTEEVGQALNVPKGADRAAIVGAAKRAGKTAAMVVKLTGAKTDAEAKGILEAWKQSHERAAKDRAEAASKEAALEGVERLELVGQLVAGGWETPATAWDDPTAKPLKPKGSLQTMPIDELRAKVATLSATPRPGGTKAGTVPVGIDLSERELKMCAEKGIDPKVYAAAKAKRKKG